MVSVRDVLPTVLDAAGARIPESVAETLAGRSLLPLLRGEQAVDWSGRSLVVEFLGKQAVRWGPWKLVQLPPPPQVLVPEMARPLVPWLRLALVLVTGQPLVQLPPLPLKLAMERTQVLQLPPPQVAQMEDQSLLRH